MKLFRISERGCEKVESNKINTTIYAEAFVDNNSMGERTSKKSENDNEKVVQSILKDRKSIERTMKSLPLPSEFWKMLILCIIFFLASVGISLTDYILYSQLFEEQQNVVQMFSYQSAQYRCLVEASSQILQLVSVSE